MSGSKPTGPDATGTLTGQATAPSEITEADAREIEQADRRLDALLDQVAPPRSTSAAAVEVAPRATATGGVAVASILGVAMRTARPVTLRERTVVLRWRTADAELEAEIASDVDVELISHAIDTGDAVVVECAQGVTPVVVGVLQTKKPREISLRAEKIHIVGEQEVVLRSGQSALRLGHDGDVELVAGRIAAMSRGLFRLVGRVLRLN